MQAPFFRLRAVSGAACLLLALVASAPAQEHDIVLMPAPDFDAADPAERLSPSIRVELAEGVAGAVQLLRRGVSHRVFPSFYINGIADATLPSGAVALNLFARPAALGDPVPDLGDPSWTRLVPPDSFTATYDALGDGPFAITRTWPDDFASAMAPGEPSRRSVTWTPPTTGDLFQVAVHASYRPGSGVAGDENPDDNLAVSLYDSASGLLDIVLVHDTSGSMGYYSYDGFSYMDLAKASAAMFIANLSDNDRFAVVEFSTDHTTGYRDVYAPEGALAAATITHKSAASAGIAGLDATGATPLGAGLQHAIDLLTAPPADGIVRKRVLLLLSDGYENTGTPRACDGADPIQPCAGTGLAMQLQANEIRAYTLALGPAAAMQCLNCLAAYSNASFYETPPGIAMAEVYLHMQQDFTGDDLYLVEYGSTGGGDDRYGLSFEGAGDVLYVSLVWNELTTQLGMELKAPGGAWTAVDALRNVHVFGGEGWLVARIADATAGDWRWRVTGAEGVDYLTAARSDRVGLRLMLDARVAEATVGEPIAITARLSRQGLPIDDAVLTATVRGPGGASFDTALRGMSRAYIARQQAMPSSPTVAAGKGGSDVAPRAALVKALSGGDGSALAPSRSFSVPLESAGNGLYKARVPGELTRISGTYAVTVTHTAGGDLRTQSRQVRLRPAPVSPDHSFAELVWLAGADRPSSWLLRTYPADRYGNAVTDPKLLDTLKARVRRGYVQPHGQLAADGALERIVIPEARRVPVLDVVALGGEPVHIGPLAPPEDGDTGAPPRERLPLLVLLALLLLGWLWLRRVQSS
jgi:Mg-chelatase subunit ChlD